MASLSNQAVPGVGYRSTRTEVTPTTPAATTAVYDPFEAFRRANQSGTNEAILRNAYKTFAGRDPDEAGLRAHLANPGGLTGGVRAIYESPESQSYRTKNPYDFSDPATRGLRPVTPAAATVPGATPAPAAVTPQVFTGFTPKHAMEGFDFAREQNTGKSAKDAFAYLSNQAPPPPLHDKAALAAWFKQYIEPGMNALGHRINSVNGDSFNFSNWQGTFDVDYGRGAGAAGGALAWQVQEPTAKLSNGAYVPMAIDPQTGQPIPAAPTGESAMPISSAIQYRRPYQGYSKDDDQQYQTPPAI
jgi:hypothetical protein